VCLAFVLTDALSYFNFFLNYIYLFEGFRYNLCIGRLVGHTIHHVFQHQVTKQCRQAAERPGKMMCQNMLYMLGHTNAHYNCIVAFVYDHKNIKQFQAAST